MSAFKKTKTRALPELPPPAEQQLLRLEVRQQPFLIEKSGGLFGLLDRNALRRYAGDEGVEFLRLEHLALPHHLQKSVDVRDDCHRHSLNP